MNSETVKIEVYKHYLENALMTLGDCPGDPSDTFVHAKQLGQMLADCTVGPQQVLRCKALPSAVLRCKAVKAK